MMKKHILDGQEDLQQDRRVFNKTYPIDLQKMKRIQIKTQMD